VNVPRWPAGQQRQALIDMGDRVEVELSGADRFDHIRAEHEMTHIRLRHQYPLRPCQPLLEADVIKAFDLLIHPTNRLDIAPLVD
jgi:hypothetical protein